MSWGDQGNGTYINPILNADYSDPDVIRVGEKYYMIASDFHFIGMQVLESDDMVNWTLISQIYDHFDHPEWNENKRYGAGAWAPSLRYHDGKFWMFVCTPHELYMSQAEKASGPWSPLHVVNAVGQWEDPCPLWDDDGNAYLGRSQWGGGPIIIHRMSPDGRELLDDGRIVYTGPVAEGVKLHKWNGYYYISIPEGGVSTGWQTILRSRNIYGPYEKKVVLEQGRTDINGPHQGALVDTPEGEWWFYHFQGTEPLGRVVHLQPAHWKDGWPVIGVDIDMNGIGEPVRTWTKPSIGKNITPHLPQTNDDFSTSKLGLQWQFNHNPVNERWSLTERKGWLTLDAIRSEKLYEARNMITQKCTGYQSEATTLLDFSKLAEGGRAGILAMGNIPCGAGVIHKNGKNHIYVEKDGEVEIIQPAKGKVVYLRVSFDAINNTHQFYYSTDNKAFTACGEAFALRTGSWKGIRTGVYTYNTAQDNGKVSFDWFTYKTDAHGKDK
ncbi:beta-xylosidase [Bacteroides sp. 51]|nr:glycoside hydrolase 43 family protein [Bacteroides sp. 51]NDV80409.1 beta-xylosidase [Bacteroides sp. 51]